MLGTRWGCMPLVAAAALLLTALGWLGGGWVWSGPLKQDTAFIVADGSSLSAVADQLAQQGAIGSATAFKLRARIFGAGTKIKAGEFKLPKHASMARILSIIASDDVLRRFVTVPEGMPSIMVYERLMANPSLTGSTDPSAGTSMLPVRLGLAISRS